MNSMFPIHPHIFNFILCLCQDQGYQHRRAEESLFSVCKRKKINEIIDSMLLFHHLQYSEGNFTAMELTFECGQSVKINYIIKK